MLKLTNISFNYTRGVGVKGISFEVNPGEFILLVGKTGAGKTSVIRLISLELIPSSGNITLERFRSRDLKRSQLPLWRRRLGIAFQDFRLLQDRSTLENVRLAAYCDRSARGRPKARALKALSSVGLSHKLHSLPGQLSTGEQQRTSIARAIVNQPYVLLADEPVSNLDSETAQSVIDVLKKLNQAGTGMLIATHQPERFESCNPRILHMDKGILVEQ